MWWPPEGSGGQASYVRSRVRPPPRRPPSWSPWCPDYSISECRAGCLHRSSSSPTARRCSRSMPGPANTSLACWRGADVFWRSLRAAHGEVKVQASVTSLTKGLKAALRPLLVRVAAVAFRARAAKIATIDDALDLAYRFRFAGVEFKPWQVRAEVRELLQMIELSKPRVVLEIGTARGGNLFLLARAAPPDSLIVSVDLPGGEFGGGYPRAREPLYMSFARE